MSKFSENLKILLKGNNISQGKLAANLGTTQQTVSRWVNGECEPDIETILNICLCLDTDPNELLGFSEISEKVKNERNITK